MASDLSPAIPKAFLKRRLHSIMGIWLVLFLMEHLIVNSQAALLVGDDGFGFIRAVQGIQEFPYLSVIEIVLLGFPFAIHAYWGIQYALTAKINSIPSDGSQPAILDNANNHAYTWQRVTSWILLFAVVAHVIHMRVVEYPASARQGDSEYHFVRVSQDSGLATIAERIGVTLYNQTDIQHQKAEVKPLPTNESNSVAMQDAVEKRKWIAALESRQPDQDHVVAVSDNFGKAELLMLRDTFKSPLMMVLYTFFVAFAAFHAFNGLWTASNRWGITLTAYSQSLNRKITVFLMLVIGFLGFAAIWMTYWINLKQ